MSDHGAAGDSKELEDLFDSVSASLINETKSMSCIDEAIKETGLSSSVPNPQVQQEKVFMQVGHMMRQLHDTLSALGYDKLLEETVSALPDAKDRLSYIAALTEQAACKVLNAADVVQPVIEEVESGSVALSNRWDLLLSNKMDVEDFKRLVMDTKAFLGEGVPSKMSLSKEQLMNIVMAQDFQDLTGQVIKKVVLLARDIESRLMGLLIETIPAEKRNESVESLLNGPVVNPDGRLDIVSDQQQVDDLLESLGF